MHYSEITLVNEALVSVLFDSYNLTFNKCLHCELCLIQMDVHLLKKTITYKTLFFNGELQN